MTEKISRALMIASLLLVPVAVSAQTAVTTTDIQRLQDEVYQASGELSRARNSDPDRIARLQNELDDLRDEVTYLKVRMRREGRVTRADYLEVRDRIQTLRSQVRADTGGDTRRDTRGDTRTDTTGERRGSWPGGTTGGVSGGTSGSTSGRTSDERSTRSQSTTGIPSGQEVDVRLESRLSSDTAQVEDRFEATTLVDLYRGDDVLIPAGSVLRGVVRTVDKATRTDRRGQLTVSFDQITVRGRSYPMRGTVSQALESDGVKGEAARIGAGAGVGAIIGGIIGGVKGALLGVLIGGGGTIAATEGRDVTLEPGTILRVRLDTPPNIR